MVNYNNPNGAIGIADGGAPRTLTILARADISGGWWVNGSSSIGVVTSGATSYASSDIEGFPVANQIGSNVIGLAINNIASGAYGTIAMRGIFLLPGASGVAVGSIYPGVTVSAGSAGTVVPNISGTLTGVVPGTAVGVSNVPVGRALTFGGGPVSEFLAVAINL